MAVEVKFFPLLAKRAKSKSERVAVPYRDGLTPMDIIRDEGFSHIDAEAIMVLINDTQAELDVGVQDGDRLEFMIGISGG